MQRLTDFTVRESLGILVNDADTHLCTFPIF